MCGKTEEWPDREGGKMFRNDKGCAHEGCIKLYVVLKALDEIKEPGPNNAVSGGAERRTLDGLVGGAE
jgi:hypothetical protein